MVYVLVVWITILQSSYSFGEKIEIQQLGEVEFYEISDFKIYQDKIYIADKALSRLYKFDGDGNLKAYSGREGRGPGEFMRGPKQIVPADSLIYVTGVAEPYYYIYDEDLNFITNNYDVEDIPKTDFIHYRDGIIYGAAYPGLEHHILIYTPKSSDVKRIDLGFEIQAGLLNRFRLLDFKDQWVTCWYHQNRCIQYDKNFVEIGRFQIPDIKEIAEGLYIKGTSLTSDVGVDSNIAKLIQAGSFAPDGSFFEEFLVLDDEHFLIQTGDQTGGNENMLIVNLNGEITQKLRLPEEGKIVGYSNDILYLLTSNETHIVAYEFSK
jgi:hypothetical protein